MAVIQEMQIGNTKIRLHDDFCVSPEEAEKLIARLAEQLRPVLVRQMMERERLKGGDNGKG